MARVQTKTKIKKNHTIRQWIANLAAWDAGMRALSLQKFDIVWRGDEWRFEPPPCSRDAVNLLENNEAVVSWLAPKNQGDDPREQVPAIFFKGQFWSLSLRMSKTIYRHIRLSHNFENIQRINGIKTLRIPGHLLKEKQRTQARFEVCLSVSKSFA